jgi:mannose-6-phosphate isomerase-like protein (cupin superfamily)
MKGISIMYNFYKPYPNPYCMNTPMHNPYLMNQFASQHMPPTNKAKDHDAINLKDYGSEPFVVNINEAAKQNNNYRNALWTGKHLQTTLMSIDVGGDIGLEMHPDVDQFIRIEQGQGLVQMGSSKDKLDFQRKVYDEFAIFIPAGTWHNLTNTGYRPIKLYSIYAPPNHPHGVVQETKAIAMAAEESQH